MRYVIHGAPGSGSAHAACAEVGVEVRLWVGVALVALGCGGSVSSPSPPVEAPELSAPTPPAFVDDAAGWASRPPIPSDDPIVDLAAAGSVICARTRAGVVRCAVFRTDQLQAVSGPVHPGPLPLAPIADLIDGCIVSADGPPRCMEIDHDGAPSRWIDPTSPQLVERELPERLVADGARCALADGRVRCTPRADAETWNEIAMPARARTIARETFGFCALLENEDVYCWRTRHDSLGEEQVPAFTASRVDGAHGATALIDASLGIGVVRGDHVARVSWSRSHGFELRDDVSLSFGEPRSAVFVGSSSASLGCALDGSAAVHCWAHELWYDPVANSPPYARPTLRRPAFGAPGTTLRSVAELPATSGRPMGVGVTPSSELIVYSRDRFQLVEDIDDARRVEGLWDAEHGFRVRVERASGIAELRHLSVPMRHRTAGLVEGPTTVELVALILMDPRPPSWWEDPDPDVVAQRPAVTLALAPRGDRGCAVVDTGQVLCFATQYPGPAAAVSGVRSARSVVLSDEAGCAIDAGGELICFDDFPARPYRALAEPRAVRLPRPGPVRSVGLGYEILVAVLEDGTVHDWGLRDDGRSGWRRLDVPAARGVRARDDRACIWTEQGEVHCWSLDEGAQSAHRLALPGPATHPPTLPLEETCACANGARFCAAPGHPPERAGECPADAPFVDVGLVSDGRSLDRGVLGVRPIEPSYALADSDGASCWISEGQVRCLLRLERPYPPRWPVPPATDWRRPAELGAVRALATGAAHTCAVDAEGTVFCWGADDVGQCGAVRLSGIVDLPSRVMDGASRVSAEGDLSCALVDDHVRCWGGRPSTCDDSPRVCGDDSIRLIDPTPVEGLPGNLVELRGACARDASGGWWCWDPDLTASRATDPRGATPSAHTCEIHRGHVRCRGAAGSGQLGDGTSRLGPFTIPGIGGAR